MRVLVTGGAGFIGSNFVEMALTDQFPEITDVVVLDKLTYAGKLSNLASVSNSPNFEFIHGDICDVELVSALVSRVDAIINFAAESHVDRSIENSSEFIRTNVLGTQVLLDAAKNYKVKKFVQVSTDEVYGSIPEGSWDENEPLLPNSPYSASKAAADLLVRSYFVTHGLNVNITRCSNNFGPKQDLEKLIPQFVNRLRNGDSVPIYGDGMNVRDWLYVNDHCEGIYIALTKGTPGEIYNIGGGTELTNLELTKMLLKFFDKGLEFIRHVEDRLGHDRRYSVNYSKIASLGYSPSPDFLGNLTTALEWYITENDK
jgi:dTDP-glucose 4,6-dehydratase